MTGVGRYRAVLRTPDVASLLAATLVGRLPIGINNLAIILFVRARTGSYAVAGVAAGAFLATTAVGGVQRGRLVDRRGPRHVMPRLVALQAVATAGLVAAGLAGAPGAALVAIAALMGFGQPPWSAVMRPLFSVLLEDASLLPTLFAVDSVLVEVSFTVGPLLTAGLVGAFSAQVALIVSAALVTTGGLAFVATPAVRRWPPSSDAGNRRHPLGALANPSLVAILLATAPAGFALGAIEVSLPAFATHHGAASSTAGVLAAVWATGSGLGGLFYGARAWRRPLAVVWAGLTCSLAAATAPLLLAPSMVGMGGLLALAGASIAPTIASGSQLLGMVTPPAMAGEAYSWGNSAIVLGAAAGAAAAGLLVQHAGGWRAAVVAAIAVAIAGAAIAVARCSKLAVGAPVPAG